HIRDYVVRTIRANRSKINQHVLRNTVEELAPNGIRTLYLVTEQGRLVISSAASSADLAKTTLPAATSNELVEHEGQTVAQSRPQGSEVDAVLQRIPQLRWSAIAEAPRAQAMREVGMLRIRTGLVLIALVLFVGVLAVMIRSEERRVGKECKPRRYSDPKTVRRPMSTNLTTGKSLV